MTPNALRGNHLGPPRARLSTVSERRQKTQERHGRSLFRRATVEDEDGNVESIYAGPEIKRFDELKVGDKVTFRYYESLVSQIRKAGAAAPTPGKGTPTLVRGTGAKPSGTLSQQLSATVTVKAIDASVPSVTVTLEDGRTTTLEVLEKKVLKEVKVGDKIDITYTAAFMITVQ